MTQRTEGEVEEGVIRKLEKIDHAIFMFLYNGIKNPVFDVLMPVLSTIANRGILQTVVGAAMIIVSFSSDNFTLRLAAISMWVATMSAGIIAEGTFKMIWKRKRPFNRLVGVTSRVRDKRLLHRPSFPSGHAAGYMAMAVSLSIFFPAYAPFFIVFGLLGAFSRIYNGVHFPSDVAAGIIIGACFGYAAPLIIRHLFS